MKFQLYRKYLLVCIIAISVCLNGFANKRSEITCGLSNSVTNLTICNNQLPFLWNGITCLTAGTFSATLTGSNGDDSIAVLNLSVINVGTSITNAIICDNELPYSWNGNNYNSSGTYSVTLTSSGGCDSVPILSLTVNHVVSSETNITICSNQLPFIWNGNNYSGSGNYSITLTSTAGCDSIANLHLTVNNTSSSNTSVTICASALPYHWNGNTYSSAGNYSVNLLNSYGCDSVANLQLSTVPAVTSNTFITICTNQLPYNWNGNNYPAAGNYAVTLAAASGCDSIATLHLTVVPLLTSTTNITVCNGQLPFVWNGNSYLAGGNYMVTLTGSSGCDSIARLTLTTVAFLTSNTNHMVCNSELPYAWNSISYNTAGTYTAAFVNSAGCDSIATLNLQVQFPQTGTDTLSICENALPFTWNGIVFTAGGPYEINPPLVVDACHSIDSVVITVQPVVNTTVPAVICNNHLPFIWNGQSYNSTGLYTVTLTSSTGCDSLVNLDLTVSPIGSSITDLTICSSQVPYNWNGVNYTSSGMYVDTLVAASGCDSIVTLNLLVDTVTSSLTEITVCGSQLPYIWNGNSYTVNGNYSITLTGSNGCDSVATLFFVVQSFLSSNTIVTVCNNQLPYLWNGNSYADAGIYNITLVTSSGCDSVATLNLQINNALSSTTVVNVCTSQLPYLWNANSYTESGIYSVTLVTTGGCDSIATLELNAFATVTSTTDITVCNNQLPFSWNGNSYPIGGSFPVTLTATSGCDSIATLNLIVTDILTSTTNVNLCPAQLPYVWNGNSYATGGTYSVTMSTPAGCDSVPILSLTVVPYVTGSTAISICSNEIPYSWNGNNYTSSGTYSLLLAGTDFCDSLDVLDLTVRDSIIHRDTVIICDSNLPYLWNGNNYITPGEYSITLTTSGGCDSLTMLTLIVNPSVYTETELNICTNQVPYLWNGNSYSSSGDYTVTLSTISGCDSIVTLHLLVSSVVSSITTIHVCQNQLPFLWNANTYPAAGNYQVSLIGSSGCDSIANLVLIVDPVPNSHTTLSVCNEELPYTWNGNSYSAAGNYQVLLQNSLGCDSIAHLHLNVHIPAPGTSNITVCENELPFLWNGQPYSIAGNFQTILTSSSGCDSIANLNLLVISVDTSFSEVNTCDNNLPFLWNGQTYTSSGIYYLTLTSSSGCDSIARLKLVVHPVENTNEAVVICSASLPFIWNGQSHMTSGIYTANLNTQAGCDSIVTLNLTVNPTPGPPITPSPLTVCQFEQLNQLTATTTLTNADLQWYNTSTGGTGSTIPPLPSSASAGVFNYYVSQMALGCEGPRSVITINVNPKPDIGPDQDIKKCFGQLTNLDLLYDTTGLFSNWILNSDTVINTTAIDVAGSYQISVQNTFGCKDTALVNLDIQPQVIADAGPDADAETGVPFQLSGHGGGSYQWSPQGSLNNPFISSPLATLDHDETFVLMVSDEIGCFDLDTVKLRVLNGPTFFVPTAFTPDGDGLNDIFQPIPIGIAKLKSFRVFNRLGELVYETSNIGEGWNGYYKGKKQPIGNYVWSVNGTDRFNKEKTMKGNVVLLR